MLYDNGDAVADLVVQLLAEGPETAKKLSARVSRARPVSIQAVYDALRQLTTSGVVLKDKRRYEINREWAHRLMQNLGGASHFPELKPGDTLTYKFKSYAELDRYWKHLHLLATEHEASAPIFYFDPHEMWLYQPGRTESQLRFLEDRNIGTRRSFMVLGGSTTHDKEYKRLFSGPNLEIDLNADSTLPRNIHLTVVGEYIIRTKIPVFDADEIDCIYHETASEEALRQTLRLVFARRRALTVKLLRNRPFACKLRKQLARNFAIPHALVKQYELW